MSRNWVIAPFNSEWPEAWDKVWEFDRQHGIISIGWVSEKMCEAGQSVRGMVICKDADRKLQYAIKPVPSISLKYLRVDFELGDDLIEEFGGESK